MRDYGRVSPRFWIGETGKKLRAAGADVQVVALYLMTSPHANMLGLYYLPINYLAHETGIDPDAAKVALQKASELGFCDYDPVAECVWVRAMAKFQIGEQLAPNDKRCKGVQKAYLELPENLFLRPFFDRYAGQFHMITPRDGDPKTDKPHESPSEAPSKPLRSQEQEQEQEQEHLPSADAEGVTGAAASPAAPGKIPSIPNCPHEQLVALYHEMLPACPRIREWNDTRRAYLRARWREKAKPNGTTQGYTTIEDGLAWWRKFFGFVADSRFLTGMSSGRGDKGPFVADLEWMVKPMNFARIIEGKYHDAAA